MLILSGYQPVGNIIKANKYRGGSFFRKNAIHSEIFARRMSDDSYKYYFVAKACGNNHAKYIVYVCDDAGKISEAGKKARWTNLDEAINMAHMLAKVPA
jgi:hypothetical protein